MTVGKLKELLELFDDNDTITNEAGKEITNVANIDNLIILATEMPVGFCHSCGNYVYKTFDIDPLVAYCPNCNRNLNSFEVNKIYFKEKEDND